MSKKIVYDDIIYYYIPSVFSYHSYDSSFCKRWAPLKDLLQTLVPGIILIGNALEGN